MKKVFLSPSELDPVTWQNYKDDNNLWIRTYNIDECDYIFYIDNATKVNHNKPKILFLIEPEEILNISNKLTYNEIIDYLQPDIIVTYYKKLNNGTKFFYTQAPLQSWISTPNIYEKNKLCSIIASGKNATYGQQLRHIVINEFKNLIDLYGNGYKPIINKEEGLKDYCFSFAIENSVESGYFTEKILDCFLTGTIPIYYGDPSIQETFDNRGIIFLTDDFKIENLSFEKYQSMLPYVKENYKKALELNPSFKKYFCSGINHYESKFINSNTSI